MSIALTHTMITSNLSPKAPQLLGATPESPCAHGVLSTSHGKVQNMLEIRQIFII